MENKADLDKSKKTGENTTLKSEISHKQNDVENGQPRVEGITDDQKESRWTRTRRSRKTAVMVLFSAFFVDGMLLTSLGKIKLQRSISVRRIS